MGGQMVTKLGFGKLIIEKLLLFITLPRTMTMIVSTSFINLDNFSTIMAFKVKHPHNLV
jgi:hypothetical protein